MKLCLQKSCIKNVDKVGDFVDTLISSLCENTFYIIVKNIGAYSNIFFYNMIAQAYKYITLLHIHFFSTIFSIGNQYQWFLHDYFCDTTLHHATNTLPLMTC